PLVVATLAVGAAFAHHATSVCLVPASLAAVLGSPLPGRRRTQAAWLLAAVALATVPYLYLVERSYAADPPYLEARAHDLGQLVDVATGGPFKGHVARLGPVALATGRVPWLLGESLAGGAWLLPLGLLGLLWALARPARRVLGWFLVASALFLLLYDVPDLEVYLLAPYVALAIAAGAVAERFAAKLQLRTGRTPAALVPPLLALAPLLLPAPIEPVEMGRERELGLLAALAEVPRGGAAIVLGHDDGLAVELLRHQPPGAPGVGVLVVPREALEAPFLLASVGRHLAGVAPLRLPPQDRALAPGAPLFLLGASDDERARLGALGYATAPTGDGRPSRFVRGPRSVPPLAFVAEAIEPAGPVDVALRRLLSDDFDPSRTILVPGAEARRSGGGAARAVEVAPDRMRLAATVAVGGGWLVVQEPLRARWRVRVDGDDAPSFQADWSYPAVRLSAGEHEVELERDTRPFEWARWVRSPWGYLVP
ncbi:MAG: hypothetical protein KDB94_07300, partial [Acidobacteria bacterium]|nr:hypothetical protein [Acidobacteriota bacterium]